MVESLVLDAQKRSESGKSAARRLRREGSIPAVLYGHGRDPEPLTISQAEFDRALAAVSGTTVIKIKVGSKTSRALIQEIQRHPTRPQILHVDFLEVHKGEKLTVRPPIRLIGSPEGVRNQGGVLDQILRELEIRVLPKDLPDHIEVDVAELTVGHSIHVRDVEVAHAEILTDPDATICTVVAPRVEAEPVAVVEEEEEEAGEPELIRKPKEEEAGEAPDAGSETGVQAAINGHSFNLLQPRQHLPDKTNFMGTDSGYALCQNPLDASLQPSQPYRVLGAAFELIRQKIRLFFPFRTAARPTALERLNTVRSDPFTEH